MKRLIFTYLLLTFFVFAQAQTNIHQRQLTMDDGLLANSVTQIVQDNRGFLWIGTANGLSRYDGVSIENYRLSELDATHGVNALLALNDGDLLRNGDFGSLAGRNRLKAQRVACRHDGCGFGKT